MLKLAAPELTATPEPAADYAHGSVSVLGSASLGVGLFGASQVGSAFQAVALSGGVSVRLVTKRGFTLEPRLGADGMLATGTGGLYAVFAARAGLGVGWAFRVSERVALTPMLSYEAQVLGGGLAAGLAGLVHSGAAELPLTVFFGPRAFVEVYLRGGVVTALGDVAPAFGAGYRFGVVW